MSSNTSFAIYLKRRRMRILFLLCEAILFVILIRQLFFLSMNRLNQYRYPSVRSTKLKPTPNEEWMEFRIIRAGHNPIAYSTDGGQSCIPVKFIKGSVYNSLIRRLYPQGMSGGVLQRVQPTEREQAYIDTYVTQNWPKYALLVRKTSEFMNEHRFITFVITFALFSALAILLSVKMGVRYRIWMWISCMLPCSFLLFLALSAYRWPREFTVFFLITFIVCVIGIVSLTFAIWYERH